MTTNNNQPKSPLEYPTNDAVPVRIFRRNRAPLTTDFRNFKVRDFWNDTSLDDLWYLTSKTTTSALWIKLGGGALGDVRFLKGDTGPDVPPDAGGVINVFGGTGITTSGSGTTITIDADAATIWEVITVSQTGEENHGYFTNAGGVVDVALPTTCIVGDTFQVVAMSAGGWTVSQNAGQSIRIGNEITTVGVGGSLASLSIGDWVTFICNVADTDWIGFVNQGVITVT